MAGPRGGPVPEPDAAAHRKARARRERRPGLLVLADAQAGDERDAPISDSPALPASPRRSPVRRWRPVLAATLIGGLAGGAWAAFVPPVYEASAGLVVQSGVRPSAFVSRGVLETTVDRLGLAGDPQFGGGEEGALPSERRRELAVERLRAVLDVRHTDGVVEIVARLRDPDGPARIANAVAAVFAETLDEAEPAAGARAEALRAAAEAAEAALGAHAGVHGLTDGQGLPLTGDTIARLEDRLGRARERTAALNQRAAALRDAGLDATVTGSVPQDAVSPVLDELRARHAGLSQEAERMAARLGPRHPEFIAHNAQLDASRRQLEAQMRGAAAAAQTELRRAVEEEQALAAELARIKAGREEKGPEFARLEELEREAATRRAAYEGLLQGTHPADAPRPSARIVSPALPPLEASGMPRALMPLGGALAGLLAGLGLAGRRSPRAVEPAEEGRNHIEPSSPPLRETEQDEILHRDHEDSPPETVEDFEPMHPYPGDPRLLHPAYYGYPQPYAPPPADAAPAPAHYYPPAPAPQAGPYAQIVYVPVPYGYAPPQQQPFLPAYPPAGFHPPAPPAAPQYAAPQAGPRAPAGHPDAATQAAIDEIRDSLRAFREALQDFADERPRRETGGRYGT